MIPESITPIINSLKRLVYSLIGPSTHFKPENQVFNAICLLAILIIGYDVPFNYYNGMETIARLFSVVLVALAFTYYLSRFKKQFKYSIIISSLLVLLTLGSIYFLNNGIKGPSLLSFSIAFFMIMIISPRSQYWFWSILCLITGLGLLFFEYKNPGLIQDTYKGRAAVFADMASTYIITILVTFIGLFYLKTAYYKEKQDAEVKTAALERMNHEKTKFFSIIAHDLRAPLASIQSYMELFRMDILSIEEKEMMDKKLSNAIIGTQEMLDNMLSWSRAELNDGKAAMEINKLHEALDSVIMIQKAASKEKKITFTAEIDPSLELFSNVHMLQLIVRNIIGNAIKFTPSDGLIELNASRYGKDCLIAIRDTGNGIPEENKSEIFTLKAQSTFGTANEKGIGLGLFLCKEYTLAQGGRIWFESQKGEGTVFYVSLPLAMHTKN
ncbi:HAMP domain-containing sensor histidine kinase [Pedobacter sp. PLR]|uniref:sensor histidine kinase n=1 Tax=Pedobacter sp. PLR TaxID=2994465 RepID=UPI0022453405|nr:HAMP domain-containing sensor histidine kinase [Pedobacter sp. PLR]MCX2450206.1 HAMP domain-containing sensor histidine kinase [Pedobacter sp. PLR]